MLSRLCVLCLLLISFSNLCFAEISAGDKLPITNSSNPGPKHKLLAPLEGQWKAVSTFWWSKGAKPQKSEALVKRSWILGDRFIKEEYSDKSEDYPFEGIGVTGYDNIQKKFTSSWIDTMGTGISRSLGIEDKSGKVITFTGTAPDPSAGKVLPYKSVLTIVDKDTTKFELYMKNKSGEEFKSLDIVYKRQKG